MSSVTADSVTPPTVGATLMRPTFFATPSANHSRPSPPVAMPCRSAPTYSPALNVVIVPFGVTRPIALAPPSVK